MDPVEEDTWGSMAAEAGRGLAPAAAVRARLSLASTAKSGAEGQRREGRTGGRQGGPRQQRRGWVAEGRRMKTKRYVYNQCQVGNFEQKLLLTAKKYREEIEL